MKSLSITYVALKGGISINADSEPMCFDAAVVFVTKFSLLFRLVLAILRDTLITLHFCITAKVIHLKYYKHLKKGAHQSHLGRQKMGWFLAD